MSAIEFRLPTRAIKDAIDNSTNEYVKRVMEPRRTECLYAVADVLNQNGYLPKDTTWEVANNVLYFYVNKGTNGEDLAHYFHEGFIYGPNIPIFAAYEYVEGRRVGIGDPIKFRSPKGKKKYNTGRYLNQYPGSSMGVNHWTEAVEEGGELFDEVVERCEEILRR